MPRKITGSSKHEARRFNEGIVLGMSPFDQRGIECGDGWLGIVDRLSNACENEIQNLTDHGVQDKNWPRIAQIKEKFGGLRFYLHGPLSPSLRRKIQQVTADGGESFKICELCGAAGSLRDGSWKRTLCDRCKAEEGNRRS